MGEDMREDIEAAYDADTEEEMVECVHCGKKTPATNTGGASVGGGASAGGGGGGG